MPPQLSARCLAIAKTGPGSPLTEAATPDPDPPAGHRRTVTVRGAAPGRPGRRCARNDPSSQDLGSFGPAPVACVCQRRYGTSTAWARMMPLW
jgi:hypothetical protein